MPRSHPTASGELLISYKILSGAGGQGGVLGSKKLRGREVLGSKKFPIRLIKNLFGKYAEPRTVSKFLSVQNENFNLAYM